jgi:hypothetical protein
VVNLLGSYASMGCFELMPVLRAILDTERDPDTFFVAALAYGYAVVRQAGYSPHDLTKLPADGG